ncbi:MULTISPECIES: sensor histidine kinase [unclassified Paenibacillus]|uniref:sensor histidine kinase n=1 Tax=unclassified Paenibacillus TaxID=185978 RepID=UPI002F42D15C
MAQIQINKQKRKTTYIPIAYKLMLSYMIFIIVLVTINGYVSHVIYDSSIRKQTKMNVQGTLQQVRDNVNYKTSDLMRISSIIYNDYFLVQNVKAENLSLGEQYLRMEQVVIPKLESVVKAIGFSQRLFIYFGNETIREVYQFRADGADATPEQQTYDIYHLKRIKDSSWYKELPDEIYGETFIWKQIEDEKQQSRISLIRRMIDTSNPVRLSEIGIMRFSVRLADLFESVDYSVLGEGSNIAVYDSNGERLFASGFENNEEIQDTKFLTIEEQMADQNWTIVANVPLTLLDKEAQKIKSFIIGICVLCFILFTFAGVFISRYFAKRITKFVAILNAFRHGDLHKRITYRGKDEFSQIATALNGMGEDVEALIRKVYLTQLQKKEAELEMLQLQINPHFLYNTLSSINQLAKFGENDKLQRMVVQLAKFYRLTLNSGKTLIPVYAEIEQSNAYLDIQKVKYGKRMEVEFDIAVSIWPYETIKLILQPFIENVLKHAWCGDRIYMRICAHKVKDCIQYKIIDDGIGMSPQRIAEIFDLSNDSETGHGIRNIDQRIKLQYGERYGVTIISRIGIGTTVQIVIPARERSIKSFNTGHEVP